MRETRYGPYRRILFCTDFSANADLAFDLALESAQRNTGCVLTLLHVLPEPEAQFWKGYIYEVDGVDAKAREDIDRKIDASYRPRLPAGLAFQTAFRVGNPSQAILDFARETATDLIVLGRQGHGSIFYGNVASRVARQAECPVLVVPMAFAKRLGPTPSTPPATAC